MMTDAEFDQFVEDSLSLLEEKQELLTAKYGLGTYENYWFDQVTGVLQFKDAAGVVKVEADVTPIGSYADNSETWQWVWANSSIVDSLRTKSEALKSLFEMTGMEVFQLEILEADENMAWELAAMSVNYLHALGCYSMSDGRVQLFVSIDAVRKL